MGTFSDLNRLRQIATVAARYGFADFVDRSGVWTRLGRKETVETSAEARREGVAKRFRLMLSELGPTFIKLGQVLSTRADLLPAEFIDELTLLQDQVPPFPLEQALAQIEQSLGKPLKELFREIDPLPMAAASIAQVHRAVTLDGEEVVIKVQRPGIEAQVRADLSALHYLARMLEAVIEEVGLYSPALIVEEFDRAIREELDFLNEAQNVRAFLASHEGRPYVRIPKVYDELSSRTVLTLEMLRAPKLSQAQLTDEEKQKIAKDIFEESFLQLFHDGLHHGDPHPGNLLVTDGPTGKTLALIDFGLVGRVTKAMQDTLVSLVTAVVLKDADSVAMTLYRVAIPDARADLVGFKRDLDGILSSKHLSGSLKTIDSRRVMREIFDLAVRYRIRLPKEYAVLARASITTEGILRTLWPDMPVSDVARPFAERMLKERLSPDDLQGGMVRTLMRLQNVAGDLPLQLSQILMDLQGGKFSIGVVSPDLRELTAGLRALGVISFFGLCACGFIVGTFVAMVGVDWKAFGIPVMGLFGFFSASFLAAVALTWFFFGNRLRKLSIARFFVRKR